MSILVTQPQATLAAAIAQALIARGEFGKGAFDKVFPEGFVSGQQFSYDSNATQGLAAIAMLALMTARAAIEAFESEHA